MVAEQKVGVHLQVGGDGVQTSHAETGVAQCTQVADDGPASDGAGEECAVNRRRLRGILESMHRGKLAVTTQRVIWVAVAAGNADDRLRVPAGDGVDQAHAASVRNEPADFLFADQHGVYRTPRRSPFR